METTDIKPEIKATAQDIKVTVIIPIYNAYNYLRPAMDSVVFQTLREIEIICIDDGSTDRSLDIIKEYQQSDDRIRIVTETNAGPALARNNGIKRARGEYVAFLDADDFYEPTFLEQMYELAKKDDLDIAVTQYDNYNSRKARFEAALEADHCSIFTEGKVTSKNEYPDYILMATVGSAWNKLFRRSFIEEKGLCFLTDVRMYEDVYFTVTAMSLAERVGKNFTTLVHHRIHSEQARAKTFSKYHSQVPVVYVKIKEFLTQTGMYAPLSSSFLNLSASRCYKIYNMLAKDAKVSFWDMIHSEYFENLGWDGHEDVEFESADIFEFVKSIELYTHAEYLRRLERGRKIKKQESKAAVRSNKKPGFFSRIFHRKDKNK